MNDYILLMQNDATDSVAANDAIAWEKYFTLLQHRVNPKTFNAPSTWQRSCDEQNPNPYV